VGFVVQQAAKYTVGTSTQHTHLSLNLSKHLLTQLQQNHELMFEDTQFAMFSPTVAIDMLEIVLLQLMAETKHTLAVSDVDIDISGYKIERELHESPYLVRRLLNVLLQNCKASLRTLSLGWNDIGW
jgi:hypothetical protein